MKQILLALVFVWVVEGQPGSPDNAQGQGQDQHQLNFRQEVHNKEHVMQHLDGVAKKPEKEMTDEELQFHYFKLHDYNNDNQLDGNELSKAMTHYHKEEGSTNDHPPPPVMADNEIASMVDQILKEDDLNNDGYVTYPEFVAAQKRAESSAPAPTDKPL